MVGTFGRLWLLVVRIMICLPDVESGFGVPMRLYFYCHCRVYYVWWFLLFLAVMCNFIDWVVEWCCFTISSLCPVCFSVAIFPL